MSLKAKKDPEKGSVDKVNCVKSPKKYRGFRKNCCNYFSEYTDNTSIHGFKYMGEQERSVIEKLYWLILLCFSLYFCTSLIYKTWIKWDQTPILDRFGQSPKPVWQIPFPAITICPETKVKQTIYSSTDNYHKMRDYLLENGNMTDEELQKISDISLVCDSFFYRAGNKTTSYKTIEYLKEIAPSFDDVFWYCKWTNSNETFCRDLFTPILTEEGICFTSNMLDRSEIFTNAVYFNGDYMVQRQKSEGWNIENGYPKDSPKDTFPRRAMSAGAKAGMSILLRASEQDLDYVCRSAVQGFKIILHDPTELPRVATQYIRVALNQEVVVGIKPYMITTSPELQNYEPHRRQCFFSNERRLKYFQTYTQQNCQIECVANHTLAKCGCVAFHMPHEETTQICGSGSLDCLAEADIELLSRELESGIFQDDALQDGNCGCLPACTSITYNTEISQADFNLPQLFRAFKVNISEFPGIQVTRLIIFFKDKQFDSSSKVKLYELFDIMDFISACGGILSLFTGFSFLSIVEIFYFLSLRWICNIRKYGTRYWSGQENEN